MARGSFSLPEWSEGFIFLEFRLFIYDLSNFVGTEEATSGQSKQTLGKYAAS